MKSLKGSLGADRHVQTHRVATVFQQVVDLVDWNAGFGGELSRWLRDPDAGASPLDPRQPGGLLNQVYPGRRMVQLWSAIPRVMAWRIHHVAYVEADPFVVELLRSDQTQVALLDEVQQHAPLRGAWPSDLPAMSLLPAGGGAPPRHHRRQVAFSVLAEALPGFQQMLGIQPGFYGRLAQFLHRRR